MFVYSNDVIEIKTHQTVDFVDNLLVKAVL